MAETTAHRPHNPSTGQPAQSRCLKATVIGDLVGYSRLVARDDLGALDRLARLKRDILRPELERCGAAARWSAGDRLMALFDSVTAAVDCACRIQRSLAARNEALAEADRLRMRIGISFGEVVLEADEATGESVIVAARLEQLCEPGGLAISEAAHREVHNKLPLGYEDFGLRRLKNLDTPLRVYRVGAAAVVRDPASAAPVGVRDRSGFQRLLAGRGRAVACAGFLLLFGLVLAAEIRGLGFPPEAAVGAAEPAIAVLPFENLAGETALDTYARGLAADLVVELSGIEALAVIARNASFRYDERPLDLRKVAGRLGARYLLDGSISKLEEAVRVNVCLIDARTQRQVWAAHYEGPEGASPAIRRQIAAKLRQALRSDLAADLRSQATTKRPSRISHIPL